ncbi:hypothetical protein KBD59_00035 [Candidatus Gracilibacteria bacterium]|nr:hypothetical protein [Candidatus Gracilibacteria bacterium]
MSEKELITVLKDGLPSYGERQLQQHYLQEMYRDTKASRNLFEERIDQRSYSNSHQDGPYELEISLDDSEMVGELQRIGDAAMAQAGQTVIANRHLGSIANFTESSAQTGLQSLQQLTLVRRGTDVLPEIEVRLCELTEASYGNMAATIMAAGLVYCKLDAVQCAVEQMNDGIRGLSYQMGDIADGITDLACEVADGFEMTNENLENIHGDMLDGFDDVNDNLEVIHDDMVAGHRAIVITVAQCAAALRDTMLDGFDSLAQGIDVLRHEQHQALTAIAFVLQDFNTQQERRHGELVGAITTVAENRNALEADEKYRFALTQYKVGNYRKALAELNKALEAQTTHLPSLLLYAQIAASRADWRNAKDTYFYASKIALLQRDTKAYELAILALAELETKLGNGDQAHALKGKAVEQWGTVSFDEEDKKSNFPVTLFFDYFKGSLFAVANKICDVDFDKSTDHLDRDEFTTYPFEPEAHINVDEVNEKYRARVTAFIDEWNQKLLKAHEQLRDEIWRYNIHGKYRSYKFNTAYAEEYKKFQLIWKQEMSQLVGEVQHLAETDPDSAYHVFLNFFDWLSDFKSDWDKAMERILTEDPQNSYGLFVSPELNTQLRRYFLNIPADSFHPQVWNIKSIIQFENLDANIEENVLDDFVDTSRAFQASCFWLTNRLEKCLADPRFSSDQKHKAMKAIVSVYSSLFEVYSRYEKGDETVIAAGELVDQREKMQLIYKVIYDVVCGLEGNPYTLHVLEDRFTRNTTPDKPDERDFKW